MKIRKNNMTEQEEKFGHNYKHIDGKERCSRCGYTYIAHAGLLCPDQPGHPQYDATLQLVTNLTAPTPTIAVQSIIPAAPVKRRPGRPAKAAKPKTATVDGLKQAVINIMKEGVAQASEKELWVTALAKLITTIDRLLT
jgi:hypothetical protein